MLSDEQACRGCSSRSTPDSAVEGGVLTEEQTFRSEDFLCGMSSPSVFFRPPGASFVE